MNSHTDETEVVRQLFQQHVPEVAQGTVQIRGIVRESGWRSVLAVSANDPKTDPVGVCVGSQGVRTKQIVAALNMEHIDIVRWSEPVERFLANLLAPWRVLRVSFDNAAREVTALVSRDSTEPGEKIPRFSPSEAPFSKAAKTRLALRSQLLSKLTGWNLKLELKNE